jgi:hypothetical protein
VACARCSRAPYRGCAGGDQEQAKPFCLQDPLQNRLHRGERRVLKLSDWLTRPEMRKTAWGAQTQPHTRFASLCREDRINAPHEYPAVLPESAAGVIENRNLVLKPSRFGAQHGGDIGVQLATECREAGLTDDQRDVGSVAVHHVELAVTAEGNLPAVGGPAGVLVTMVIGEQSQVAAATVDHADPAPFQPPRRSGESDPRTVRRPDGIPILNVDLGHPAGGMSELPRLRTRTEEQDGLPDTGLGTAEQPVP